MANSASILITTYNWKEALDRVLASVLAQSELPKEVVIADDGSREDTKDLIDAYKKILPVPLIHCWQEDKGFRAAAIRNKAIANMTADYVIMIDGDMCLHPHFVRDHRRAAKKGVFVQGSRVITSRLVADKILSGELDPQSFMSFFTPGIGNRLNALNSSVLSKFFSRIDTQLKSTKTCNFSAWREDLIDINGFNEDYIGWGREDSDLVARLFHKGLKRIKLKFMANAYHLYHKENPRDHLSQNDTLLKQCLQSKQVRCENGLDKYILD